MQVFHTVLSEIHFLSWLIFVSSFGYSLFSEYNGLLSEEYASQWGIENQPPTPVLSSPTNA